MNVMPMSGAWLSLILQNGFVINDLASNLRYVTSTLINLAVLITVVSITNAMYSIYVIKGMDRWTLEMYLLVETNNSNEAL